MFFHEEQLVLCFKAFPMWKIYLVWLAWLWVYRKLENVHTELFLRMGCEDDIMTLGLMVLGIWAIPTYIWHYCFLLSLRKLV